MDYVSSALAILLFVFWILCIVWWHLRRAKLAKEILNHWAQSAGFELLSVKRAYLQTGPMPVPNSVQFVFHIKVKNAAGTPRNGWVSLGGSFLGLLSKNIKVIWDD